MNRGGRALRGGPEYIERPKGRHAKCEPPSWPIGHKPKRIRHLRGPVGKEGVISRVPRLSGVLWVCLRGNRGARDRGGVGCYFHGGKGSSCANRKWRRDRFGSRAYQQRRL